MDTKNEHETNNSTGNSQSPLVDAVNLFYGEVDKSQESKSEIPAGTEEADKTEKLDKTEPKTDPDLALVEDPDKSLGDDKDKKSEDLAEEKTEEPEFNNSEMYVELEGKDVSLEQILEWKTNGLKSADYTQKTQILAQERKDFEADRDGALNALVESKLQSYKDNIALMEELIAESDVDQYGESINWSELRKDDIDEYDRLKGLKKKREEAVKESRDQQLIESSKVTQESAQAELVKLAERHPEWSKDGKNTQAYTDDMKMIESQLDKAGISPEQRGGMLLTGLGSFIIDACRWRQSQNKVQEVKAKVKKLPITTKPTKSKDKSARSAVDIMYGNN